MKKTVLRPLSFDGQVARVYDDLVKSHTGPISFRMGQDEVQLVQAFARSLRGARRVLEVGCGIGGHASVFSQSHVSYIGIDVSQRTLEVAARLNSGCSFIQMSACDLQFPDAHFDGVWDFMCTHHVPKKSIDGVLRSFRRVLRQGGLLHVAVLNGDCDAEIQSSGGKPSAYIARYSVSEFRDRLKAAGFIRVDSITRTFLSAAGEPAHCFLCS